MKTLELTYEELNTLMDAVSSQYSRSYTSRVNRGEQEQSNTEKRLLEVSEKLYHALTH